MTRQTPPIDWEAAMKRTEENSRIAAKMSERAVAAMAETLDNIDRHGKHLIRLEAMVKQMKAQVVPPPPQPRLSLPSKPAPRHFHPLPIIAAFLAGAVFAAFIVSW